MQVGMLPACRIFLETGVPDISFGPTSGRMTMNIKLTLVAGTALALLTALPAAAQSAQDFPTKPMTYIIPFNAGGESDVSARYPQDRKSTRLHSSHSCASRMPSSA